MIINFRHKETDKIFNNVISKKIHRDVHKRALIKLLNIHKAKNIEDLSLPPSNNLEILQGDRKGQYSIIINDKYRIRFVWHIENKNSLDVEIVDYHK